jgi:hypothetical protein
MIIDLQLDVEESLTTESLGSLLSDNYSFDLCHGFFIANLTASLPSPLYFIPPKGMKSTLKSLVSLIRTEPKLRSEVHEP